MHVSDHRLRTRAELTDLATRLVSDYSGRVPADVVLSCVARCQEELRRAGAGPGMLAAVEAMARTQLEPRVPPHTGIGRA